MDSSNIFGKTFEVSAPRQTSAQTENAREAFQRFGWHHVVDVLLEEAGTPNRPISTPHRLRHRITLFAERLGERMLIEDGEGFRVVIGYDARQFVEFRKEEGGKLVVQSTYDSYKFITAFTPSEYANALFAQTIDYLLAQ